MPTNVAYPGRESNGDTLSTTNFDLLPGGWLAYIETTSAQTGISTETVLSAFSSVVVTVNTSRRIKLSAQARVDQNTGAAFIKAKFKEGATIVGMWCNTDIAANSRNYATGFCVLTPSGGSHTYSMSLATSTGTCDYQANTADPAPGCFLIEDIGHA